MRTSLLSVAFASVLAFGCSSSSHEVDPTSREALQKAPPLQYGCKYTEESNDFVDGDYIGSSSIPMCATGKHCSEIGSPTNDVGGYAAGSTYNSSSYYSAGTEFIGTCDDPQPISCDDYKDGDACDECVGKSCCAPAFLCDHDPNCKAIVDCIKNCKDDSSCIQRCVANGEPSASANLQALAECTTGTCASACGN